MGLTSWESGSGSPLEVYIALGEAGWREVNVSSLSEHVRGHSEGPGSIPAGIRGPGEPRCGAIPSPATLPSADMQSEPEMAADT